MEYVIIQVVKVLENFVLADTNARALITEFCKHFLRPIEIHFLCTIINKFYIHA